MENWVQKAIAQWKDEALELNEGANVSDIEKAEDQIGFKFPDDFKELYIVINGFVNFEMRGFMLSLWSLDRVVSDYDPNKNLIMFSDHSLSICQYGFSKNRAGIFKAYTHFQEGPIELISESFQKLIALFNVDAEQLF